MNDENRSQCESEVVLSRTKSEKVEGTRECLTVKDMMQRGWPKGKILGAIKKGGGILDEHDPQDPMLTAYWCITQRKKVDSEEMKREATTRVKTQTNNEAMNALLGGAPSLPPALGTASTPGLSPEQLQALTDAIGAWVNHFGATMCFSGVCVCARFNSLVLSSSATIVVIHWQLRWATCSSCSRSWWGH